MLLRGFRKGLPRVAWNAQYSYTSRERGNVKNADLAVTYGYALAIALTGFVMLDAGGLPGLATAHALCLLLFGLRLIGYLAWRDSNVQRFNDRFRSESKTSGWVKRLPFILGCSFLYLGMVSPVVLTARYADTASPDATRYIQVALALALIGWLVEAVGDFQKSYYKAKNGPGKWVSEGLFSVLRHPNYTGEQLLWAGSTLVGMFSAGGELGTPEALPWAALSLLGFVGIQYVLTSATTSLEGTQGDKYGKEPGFLEYKRGTWAGFTLPRKQNPPQGPTPEKEKSS
eukprot:jgi/Mesvir1/27076/Mv20767-RA.2